MTAAATFIPQVFEAHLESAGLLWAQRRGAIRSWEHTPADLLQLDDKLDAHIEGLAAAGDDAVPRLQAELKGDDPMRAFAAAFALLRQGSPSDQATVLEAFAAAQGTKLNWLRDALAHGPAASLAPLLAAQFHTAPPPVAAAAGEVLAFHGMMTPTTAHAERLIRAEEPSARAAAWRIVGYCGLAVPAEWYAAGLRDEDPAVKWAVVETAAWNRSPGFYPYARSLAATPTPAAIDVLALLAAVAPPEEYQLIAAVASNPAAGPRRYRVIGSFGHPYFIPFLIEAMARPEPAAISAAEAFEKMTGRAVVTRPIMKSGAPEQAPETEFTPDPDSARKHWAELAPALAYASRIARGVDVSQAPSREAFDLLDMESRYEHCLRARLYGGWQGTPLVLERYPHQF